MRYLGIDYGSKHVGLALSDEAGVMGFPYRVVTNTPRLLDEICALITSARVEAVVIGESKDFSGKENKIAKSARALGDALAARMSAPVFYEPEVLTSAEARRLPAKESKSRTKARRDARIDASAAALILTSYLSRIKHG